MGLRLRFASSSVSLWLPNNDKVSIKLSSVELQLFFFIFWKKVSVHLWQIFHSILCCLSCVCVFCVCVCVFLLGGVGDLFFCCLFVFARLSLYWLFCVQGYILITIICKFLLCRLFDWRPDLPPAARLRYERIVILKNMFDVKEFEVITSFY